MIKWAKILLIQILTLLSLNGLLAQQTVGLFLNDSLALNGYTLFAPSSSFTTYLIDNCGNLVHQWESEYFPGEAVYLMENGQLLRTERKLQTDFSGGGLGGRLEILDWESNVVWFFEYHDATKILHHDVELLPNGNILLLAWEKISEEQAIEAGRNPDLLPQGEIWGEFILEITPILESNEAEIVWEWHVWDHLIQDYDASKENFGVVENEPYKFDINFAPNTGRDWLHFNSIDYNETLDQILLSSAFLNEIYILDHSTTTEEAAGNIGGNSDRGGDLLYRWGNPMAYRRGEIEDQRLFGQHDAQWINQGNENEGDIMIYNNGLERPVLEYSSVDVINPPLVPGTNLYDLPAVLSFGPTDLSWTYEADPPEAFYSPFLSGASRLSNGNTLICVGRYGRFFEVTSTGEKVWEYISPVANTGIVSQGQSAIGNAIFRAQRISQDDPRLSNFELVAGEPIELDPLPSDCVIYDEVVSINHIELLSYFSVYPNPAEEVFFIKNEQLKPYTIEVYNTLGQLVFTKRNIDGGTEILSNNWDKGWYVVKVIDTSSNKAQLFKLVIQ